MSQGKQMIDGNNRKATYIESPNGTLYKVTVSDAGQLQIAKA